MHPTYKYFTLINIYHKNILCYIYRYDRKVMTLWGDFAEIEGQMLQISLESDKPVLAFCDVKSSIYQDINLLS